MSVVRRQFVAAAGALVCVLAVGVPTAMAAGTPLTRQATSVTGETAVLNGELVPVGSVEKVAYHFAYNMGSACTGGSTLPSSPPYPEAEDNDKNVSLAIAKGLEGNTEYTFCLVTTTNGALKSFTTLRVEPEVLEESDALKSQDPFVAELKAEVNPENEPATSCVFEYGTTTAYGSSKACATLPSEGVTPQGVSAVVEGLEAGTTYHYRVVVGNAAGLTPTAGEDEELTTEAAKPPALEGPASSSNVTPFTATVSATVNPELQETSCEFQYGTSKATVEKGEGTSVPCSSPELGGGSPTGGSASLENLTSNTEYFFRVVVENAQSRLEGKPVASTPAANFKTREALAPIVEKVGDSGITPFEVTLEATLNPEYELTTCEVEYGETVGEHKAPCVPSTVEGGPGQKVSLPLTGLEKATPYHYRFVIANATESAAGEGVVTTASAKAPVVEKQSSSGVTPFSANVSAEVNPEYQETSCEFQYGPEGEETAVLEGERGSVPCKLEEGRAEKIIKAGGSPVPVTAALTGLEASEHYIYRVVAKNATETTDGSPLGKFTTGPERAPSIVSKSLKVVETAGPKLEITAGDAKLEVKVEPNYEETEVTFECSSSEALVLEGQGERVGAKIPAGLGEAQTVSVDLQDNLRPNTTYYCRVSATNATGGTPVETGSLLSFKTLIGPLVVTNPAIEVGVTSATLTGTVNPQAVETHYRWAYVQQAVYEEALKYGAFHEFEPTLNPYLNGVVTPAESSAGIPVVAPKMPNEEVPGPRAPVATQPMTIENLAPGTTYHYALVAENKQGSKTIGAGGTFTTSSHSAHRRGSDRQRSHAERREDQRLGERGRAPHALGSAVGNEPGRPRIRGLRARRRRRHELDRSDRRAAGRRYRLLLQGDRGQPVQPCQRQRRSGTGRHERGELHDGRGPAAPRARAGLDHAAARSPQRQIPRRTEGTDQQAEARKSAESV